MEDLFTASQTERGGSFQPLAEKARPHDLAHFVGQDDFLGQGKLMQDLLTHHDRLPSLIFWGPPGCGKTSLAHLISKSTKSTFVNRSAIDTGAKELKAEGEQAKNRLLRLNEMTILFIDEIHRLNTAQQDCLLPYMEKGYLSLIGATTENPSFELNAALLSRCQVIVFKSLDQKALEKILDRGLNLLDDKIQWSDLSSHDLKKRILHAAGGDGRRALNLLENIYSFYQATGRATLDEKRINEALAFTPARYDKNREMHYDVISAFIKSIRGSDPHAALYYLARMLKGGEDPLFIARRLVILASEDIGNADPRALQVAINVKEAVEFVGLPEAGINLAQGVSYLASCPKSNRSYMGLLKAQELVDEFSNLEVPLSIRNAPTKLMKVLGYGEKYQYSHNDEGAVNNQKFLPEEIQDQKIYEPSEHGFEKNISAYLHWVDEMKKKIKGNQ